MTARKIPVGIRISILFGSVFAKMLTMAFCMSLVIITLLIKDIDFSLQDWRYAPKVIGTITKVEKTNSSVNNEPIYKYTFTYTVQASGFENYSYGTKVLQKGEQPYIEYLIDKPSRARIVGFSENELSPLGVIAYSVLLLPFLFIYLNYLKAMRALEYGIKVKGKLIKKEECSYYDQTPSSSLYYLIKYHFKFVDQSGQEHTIVEWSEAPNYFEKTKDATILLDPIKPERSKALSLINGAPLTVLDEEIKGKIKTTSFLAFIIVIVSCLISVYNLLSS